MRNDGGRAVAHRQQKTQAVHLPRLPPLGGERRECEAGSENDREPQWAPALVEHGLLDRLVSARSRINGEVVRPSAFAVFMKMTGLSGHSRESPPDDS